MNEVTFFPPQNRGGEYLSEYTNEVLDDQAAVEFEQSEVVHNADGSRSIVLRGNLRIGGVDVSSTVESITLTQRMYGTDES